MHDNIAVLKGGSAGRPHVNICGAAGSDVLNFACEAPPRPPNEACKALEQYFKLIGEGKGEFEEPANIRGSLYKWLGRGGILSQADILTRKNKLKGSHY